MYFPPSIRTRIISLFFLIQYTMANDSGLQTIYQEDNSDALSITDNALLAISGPSQFTTPFTSGGASSTSELQNPNPQDHNGPDSLRLSNDNCHSAAEQPYPSRRRRKRQNEKTFCDSPAPGASNQPENSNGITNSNPKTQNSAPARTPNGVPTPPPELDERLHNFLYSLPGWDGRPNPAACNNPDYPLFQVPICAPQVNPSVGRTSPASFVAPCKFSKFFLSLFLIPTLFCAAYLMEKKMISDSGRVQ